MYLCFLLDFLMSFCLLSGSSCFWTVMPLQKKMHWLNTTSFFCSPLINNFLPSFLSSLFLTYTHTHTHTHTHTKSSPLATVKVSELESLYICCIFIHCWWKSTYLTREDTRHAFFFLPPVLKSHQCVHQTCSQRNQSDRHAHTSSPIPASQ